MTRVLFVDDERRILDGLRRQLRSLRTDWSFAFSDSGPAALGLMDEEPFDVVVSDMKMPGMDGAELLRRVSVTHPHTVRIVLSGHADREAILKAVGPAHQYLAKPCDADQLRETISKACALRRILGNDALLAVVSQIETLPSLPGLYVEVREALQNERASRPQIAKIISSDIGMSAQLLKVANSAFFGTKRSISDVSSALAYLGLDTVQALVLTAGVFRQFEGQARDLMSLETIWAHSLRTARLASALARAEGFDARRVDGAFASAILHDVGKVVLLSGLPDEYAEVLAIQASEGCTTAEAERRIFGTSHGEVGGYLMGIWGLPDSILEGVAYHLHPNDFPLDEISHVTLVHVADAYAHDPWEGDPGDTRPCLDHAYLDRIGVRGRLADWARTCAESEEATDE